MKMANKVNMCLVITSYEGRAIRAFNVLTIMPPLFLHGHKHITRSGCGDIYILRNVMLRSAA